MAEDPTQAALVRHRNQFPYDSDKDLFRKKKNKKFKKLDLDLGFSRRLFSSDDHELEDNATIKKPGKN